MNRNLLLMSLSVLLQANDVSIARAAEPSTPREGSWRAWVDGPGGELPFDLELRHAGDAWQATIINGGERRTVPVVTFKGGELILDIDYYDSTIRARVSNDGGRLEGTWVKKGRGDQWSTLPFHAEAGRLPRFPRPTAHRPAASRAGETATSIAGRWSVRFEKSEDPAIGLFEQGDDGTVTGTFLTSTGDYRFLAGRYDDGLLRLSAFDGAHALLFHAECQADGTLKGDFWSRDAWHEGWTAQRDPDASLPDAFSLTRPTERVDLNRLRFPDVDGTPRALSDPALLGKGYVLDIFGTWCPNCHDATLYLNELHARYQERGLSIVGLAFELTGDFPRDARLVRRYVQHHHIRYPVLVAGEAVREKVAESVPCIDRLRAYPTLIFIDSEGVVRGVYTGFSGPATGEAHIRMRRQIEAMIESMLAD